MQKFKVLMWVIVAVLLMASVIGTSAQDNPGVAFAGMQDGKLTVFGLGDAPLVVNNPPFNNISSIVWSPDGDKLAYLLTNDQFNTALYVVDVTTGAEPVKIETGALASGFPVTFTADGKILYIGQMTTPTDPSTLPQATAMQIAPEPGAQPETLGSFGFSAGCGGGASFPTFWRYWEDAGFGGSAFKVILTDYGLLHNITCSGGNLAILNLQTGQDTFIGARDAVDNGQPTEGTLGRVLLSPDGKTLAAVRFRQAADLQSPPVRSLALVDLATLAVTDVQTAAEPDQLAWNKDASAVFYSSITETGNLLDGLTAEQISLIAPISGYVQNNQPIPIPTYQSTIHQYNVTTGEDTLLYTADAFAFGRMAAAPDGQHLIASQIANLDALVTAITDGTLDISNGVVDTKWVDYVPLTLYQIPLVAGETPTAIADNVSQFVLRPTRQ
ncbi:MAG: hypothetical protein ABI690_17650 [Chloroflexota bacterium]